MKIEIIIIAILICLHSTLQAGQVEQAFAKAKEAFVAKEYGDAAKLLRELADSNQWSHGALHNLGNTEWKVARPGYAILAWERARTLNPFDKNTVANLRFARTKANLIIPERAWYEQYSEWLPAWAWLWMAFIGIWGAITLFAAPRIFNMARADWNQGVAALLLAIFFLVIPAVFGLHTRENTGVILEDQTPLRLTPTADGEPLTKLMGGEFARLEKKRVGYYYIRADGDRTGWVKESEFTKIWP